MTTTSTRCYATNGCATNVRRGFSLRKILTAHTTEYSDKMTTPSEESSTSFSLIPERIWMIRCIFRARSASTSCTPATPISPGSEGRTYSGWDSSPNVTNQNSSQMGTNSWGLSPSSPRWSWWISGPLLMWKSLINAIFEGKHRRMQMYYVLLLFSYGLGATWADC